MNAERLSALVNRVIACADRLQRRHGVPGSGYAGRSGSFPDREIGYVADVRRAATVAR